MKASETFHHPIYKHNCAQAIANKWAQQFQNPDTIVAEMQANGGGRAKDGLCGALFAAISAYPEQAECIKNRFFNAAGDIKCQDIKQHAKTSCIRCIDIADEILTDLIKQ